VETDQRLTGLRAEFLEYLWNNLDDALFKQWYPAHHRAFAWLNAPKHPGDIGAELLAKFRSTESFGGPDHTLEVTYIDPASSATKTSLEYAMMAEVRLDGEGPLSWTVEYELEGEVLHVKQRFEVPETFTETDALRTHLETRMQNLTGFLRDTFDKKYMVAELQKRGTATVTTVDLEYEIVVEQKIAKLTPDMLDWWWDNMGETERYKRWHPTAHVSFIWTTPPQNPKDLAYSVGAMQQVIEIVNGAETTLNIGWLDPAEAPKPRVYDRYLYGSTALDPLPAMGFLLHEYAALPEGGVAMRSTFRIPTIVGDDFANALGEHCKQEMQFLQYVLPKMFATEYKP